MATAIAVGPVRAQEDGGRPYQLESGVRIPMRDGISLNANIYRPTSQVAPLPVIVTITPYTLNGVHATGAYFARHGYVFAAVDTRGRGDSGGKFFPTTHEAEDGYDVVQWLSRKPYGNGKVGMWGGSYCGRNQWVIAALARPPALKTIVPASAGSTGIDRDMRANIPITQGVQWWAMVSGRTMSSSVYNDRNYWIGVQSEMARGDRPFREFDQLAGFPSLLWQENLKHPQLDGYWDHTTGQASRLSADQLAGLEIPILSLTGTYDASQAGAFAYHDNFLAKATPAARNHQFMVVGPWDHGGTRSPRRIFGGVDFGEEGVIDVQALHVAWYDWVLKGGPLPAFLKEHFVYYIAGSNRWAASPTADATASTWRRLFLSSPSSDASSLERRGELVSMAPRQPADQYIYDPSEPGRNEGLEGYELVSDDYLTNSQAVSRLNGEGLIYDSAPMPAPLDLVGRPKVGLTMTMDVRDTDVRVTLYVVRRDGTQIVLAQDQLRARYRRSLEHAELVTPGKAEFYGFSRFDFVARTLDRGDRLRLVISPLGLSIHDERNRNSGDTVADETKKDNRRAVVQVALGPLGSWIDIPVGRPADNPAN
jgi:putative CocE/NonD family hydrolase